MHSEKEIADLRDIQHHIKLANEFAGGLDYAGFLSDARSLYAVTRCLEIISEASRRLSDALKARHSSIPWKDIAGAGNVYRHDYEDITPQLVWNTVAVALPALREAIDVEMADFDAST